MMRSSTTRMESTVGASLFPTHSRSSSSLATTPEEEMYVMPPKNSAGSRPHPSKKPAANPGVKFRARSRSPDRAELRRLETSSSAV